MALFPFATHCPAFNFHSGQVFLLLLIAEQIKNLLKTFTPVLKGDWANYRDVINSENHAC